MNNKNGFTLIELLAVIIILGILMIIAIPAVTKYITDSRKTSYISIAKNVIEGARTLANSETLNMRDEDTTYYIPIEYIKTENGLKSPYGEFTEAYVGVIYDKDGYHYYWISNDSTGQGIKDITSYDFLDEEDIIGNITDSIIRTTIETTGIGSRSKIKIFDIESHVWENVENGAVDLVTESGNPMVCKKAKILHTATCTSQELGCKSAGYVVGNKGTTITYGTIPNGNPKPGDAYDCKVSISEGYTERFYYLQNDGGLSSLIYYKNNNDFETYAYDSSGESWHGPRTGYQHLPSTSAWNNPNIITPGTRQIVSDNGGTTSYGNQIASFTYTDKAARFLTFNEAKYACGNNLVDDGDLENCNWLLENIEYYETGSGVYGYWLETPNEDNNKVWRILSHSSCMYLNYPYYTDYFGVRPVITIKTSFIEQ